MLHSIGLGGHGTAAADAATARQDALHLLNASVWSAWVPLVNTDRAVGQGIHLVTVATERRPQLTTLETSVRKAFGPDATITVLGLGLPWNGLGCKIAWVREHVLSIPAGDLVIFADAYDVIATAAAANFSRCFCSHNVDVLFAGEVTPSPDPAVALMQDSSSPLPYLNSGLFAGEAWAIAAMLHEISEDLALNHEPFVDDGLAQVDDQRWFTRFFLRHHQKHTGQLTAAVDGFGHCFHCLHAVHEGALRVVAPSDGRVVSDLTGTEPAFLHGNAGGRGALARTTSSLASWLADKG